MEEAEREQQKTKLLRQLIRKELGQRFTKCVPINQLKPNAPESLMLWMEVTARKIRLLLAESYSWDLEYHSTLGCIGP